MPKPIYLNQYGEERPWSELVDTWGNIVYHPAPANPGDVVWRCTHLIARRPIEPEDEHKITDEMESWLSLVRPFEAAAIICQFLHEDGLPAGGLRVAWYWPDAPEDIHIGPEGGVPGIVRSNRGVHGQTNLMGIIGHPMGGGAFYWPSQGQIGPHATWAYGTATKSDVIAGLGMLGGTNHDHLDAIFEQVTEGTAPPPQPPTPPVNRVLEQLAIIEAAEGDIAAARSTIEALLVC